MSLPSPTYCVLPWMHQHVGVDGSVRLCCISKHVGSIADHSLKDIYFSDKMNEIRHKLLTGEKPDECESCWELEKTNTVTSKRINNNNVYKHLINKNCDENGQPKEFKLHYVDYRFNNLCNFKCRMCYPENSSSGSLEKNKLISENKYPVIRLNNRWDRKNKQTNKNVPFVNHNYGSVMYDEIVNHYSTVEEIYFIGGEPMMQKEHFDVLRDLIALGRAKDVKLQYSVNGTNFNSKLGNVYEYWKHFNYISLLFSIDGYGEKSEYWRGPGWDSIENNIKLAKEFNNIIVGVHSTVGWPNLQNWVDFVKYSLETDLIPNGKITGDVIFDPMCFSILKAPKFKKDQMLTSVIALDAIVPEDYKVLKAFLKYLIHYINEPSQEFNYQDKFLFDVLITKTDELRNVDFFKALPEHQDMREFVQLWKTK